ncbi:MAG: hypothetical protein HKK67_07080 [Chlorobiaceae bacterium]|nr:hypothetical protein [Chlorobiaceae bacterium]
MEPIIINDYCFKRVYFWMQYTPEDLNFTEIAIDIYYPKDRKANGLVMFSHGFMIGPDFLYLPKRLLAGMFSNEQPPLFANYPSYYYNYTSAIVEKNWAMAFVTSTHKQNEFTPTTDFGGNPRVGQEAYLAASYLICFGATSTFYNASRSKQFQFMNSNNVIFAGHSVGGAHAQVAATGFDNLNEIGKTTKMRFDPIVYDRIIFPRVTEKLSNWGKESRANPVGLVQLSPVDMKNPLFGGMEPYRQKLATISIPNLMIVGQCDCACLDTSQPPAWSCDSAVLPTEYSQMAPAGSSSWATVANVEKGSHCGYLTAPNPLCSMADSSSQCKRCPNTEKYTPVGNETDFTAQLFKRFIDMYPFKSGLAGTRAEWLGSDFLKWLNNQQPDKTSINLVPFSGGQYVYHV